MRDKIVMTVISAFIFLTFIPLAIINETFGWIPDVIIFLGLVVFYYFFWEMLDMNIPIYLVLIIGHISHAMGIFGWYSMNPFLIQYDHITHFLGSLGVVLVIWQFMKRWMDKRLITKKNIMLLGVVVMAAFGVGATVELMEFVGYLSFGMGDDGIFFFGAGDGITGLAGNELIDALGGGWINLGWDLVYNALGIITGIILYYIARKTWQTYKKQKIRK